MTYENEVGQKNAHVKNNGSDRNDERRALEQIKGILSTLDADGYLNTAFAGTVSDAEQNIRDDAMYSLRERFESAKSKIEQLKKDFEESQKRVEELEKSRTGLLKEIESLEEWKPYDKMDCPDEKYEYLAHTGKELTVDEAKALVAKEFGFDASRVGILETTTILEISRRGVLRCAGHKVRKPLYFSTDWNYVHFTAGGYNYEMVDGELNRLECC